MTLMCFKPLSMRKKSASPPSLRQWGDRVEQMNKQSCLCLQLFRESENNLQFTVGRLRSTSGGGGVQRFPEEVTYELSLKGGWPGRPTPLLLENCLFPTPPGSVGLSDEGGHVTPVWPISVCHPSSHNDWSEEWASDHSWANQRPYVRLLYGRWKKGGLLF